MMICLSVHDLSDRDLLEAFWKFKLKIIEFAFSSPTSVDETTECLKALGKACQALFLRVKPPEIPLRDIISENGRLLPFEGPLSFINDLLPIRGYDRRKLSYNEARILAQIGNSPRGLSYPSTNQVRKSIEETIEIVTTKETPKPGAINLYKKGLEAVRTSIGKRKSNRTHVSLVASGSSEASRNQGGRARVLVISARRTTDLEVPDECNLVGMFDQFGEEIISKTTWELFKLKMKKNIYLRNPTLGDLLFVKPGELEENLNRSLNENFTVPKELAKILNLTASKLIRSNGSYDPPCVEIFNTIAFSSNKTRYRLEVPLQVKADVSIESGLKARLITAPQAAFAHLSQLPANLLREYYSQDPFHRVGFEESDKLWEVLKAYSKQDD
jgi:DNA-binding transcriptional regulator/RsmH inhibitor MraZ